MARTATRTWASASAAGTERVTEHITMVDFVELAKQVQFMITHNNNRTLLPDSLYSDRKRDIER